MNIKGKHSWCSEKSQAVGVKSGVPPNLWDLMPNDLRWFLYNNSNKVSNKCNALESSSNHPPIHGKPVFHKNGPWCQKGWGLLVT